MDYKSTGDKVDFVMNVRHESTQNIDNVMCREPDNGGHHDPGYKTGQRRRYILADLELILFRSGRHEVIFIFHAYIVSQSEPKKAVYCLDNLKLI